MKKNNKILEKKVKDLESDQTVLLAVVIILIIIILISVSSATEYTVSVNDGIGAGTGDTTQHNPTDDDDDDPEPHTPVHYKIKLNNYIQLKDRLSNDDDPSVLINEGMNLGENTSTSNTAKIPIDYTPYIIWSIVILFILALVVGSYWIYQIYFY